MTVAKSRVARLRMTRQEVIDNHSRLAARNELYCRYGYDVERELQFVLGAARPLAGRILEIGTGQGRFLVTLLGCAARVTTVDIDPDGQRIARLNVAWAHLRGHDPDSKRIRSCPPGRAQFVAADAARLPWKDRAFDYVVSVYTLHHMTDIPGVLREIVRVIRPTGKIVLADFNTRGLAVLQRVHRLEGRDHECVKYRFDDLVSRLAALGWSGHIENGGCVDVLIGRRSRLA
jgi:ubiquinone/menaquinone biosynthesis C-methylase UbiE